MHAIAVGSLRLYFSISPMTDLQGELALICLAQFAQTSKPQLVPLAKFGHSWQVESLIDAHHRRMTGRNAGVDPDVATPIAIERFQMCAQRQ